jgi:hypothetical protein
MMMTMMTMMTMVTTMMMMMILMISIVMSIIYKSYSLTVTIFFFLIGKVSKCITNRTTECSMDRWIHIGHLWILSAAVAYEE